MWEVLGSNPIKDIAFFGDKIYSTVTISGQDKVTFNEMMMSVQDQHTVMGLYSVSVTL